MTTTNTRKIDETVGAAALTQWQAVIRPAGAVVEGTGGGDLCYGVAQDGAEALAPVVIATAGPTKGIAGAAIAKGDKLMLAANGRFVLATTGNLEAGEAESSASGAGAIFDLLLFDNKGNVAP